LVDLGRRRGVPVYEDLGSGSLTDLSPSGFCEPTVEQSVAAGVDLVSFSGDKLLGGPQAGILAGRRGLIERLRRHPLFRALRVDKLVIAALEATLLAYLRGDSQSLPVLGMIRMTDAEIGRRARVVLEGLRARVPAGQVTIDLVPGESVIGGGSTPEESLPTYVLRVSAAHRSAAEVEERLRRPASGPAVVARITEERVTLDLRTVFPHQEAELVTALIAALS
jgi:L-seryl-tRNA(Ser) seleniumtransferase